MELSFNRQFNFINIVNEGRMIKFLVCLLNKCKVQNIECSDLKLLKRSKI